MVAPIVAFFIAIFAGFLVLTLAIFFLARRKKK